MRRKLQGSSGQDTGEPGTRVRGWLRSAVALPAAAALALPLSTLTQLAGAETATARETSSVCPADSAVDTHVARSRHVSGGAREAIARRAAARWFPRSQLDLATAVAGGESSWEPTAVNRAAGGNFGLWQINSVHADLLTGRRWQDPDVNAWMAYRVWDAADGKRGNHRGSWRPWSVYNSGSYRSFLRRGAQLPPETRRSSRSTGSTDEPTADGCATTGAPAVRVGTWNALKSNSSARIAAGTRDLTSHTDVFGLQELGNETKRSAAARGAKGFTMTTDHTAVPILYRTSQYTLLDQGRQLAIKEGARVERSSHDGRSVMGPKWVTWAHLQDKVTEQSFYVVNTHMLVGAENSRRMRRANPRRVQLYERQLAALTALTDRFRADGSTVYATCDCNVNYSATVAPVVTMGAHGLVPSWHDLDSRATHGRRSIDYVWSTTTPASQITGARHGSDHAFLAVTFLPSAANLVLGGVQQVDRTRTITDPTSGKTYGVAIPEGRAGEAIDFALDQLGDKWKWGAHGPRRWDCSGLTAAAFHVAGVRLPAQSGAQRRALRHVPLAQARPGDLFWHHDYVAIYLGRVKGHRIVVGSLRKKGAVVIHPMVRGDIKAVLRPVG